jgi:hypothetical protein
MGFCRMASAEDAAHPLDGVWVPDIEASVKIFDFPEGLKKDLAGMRMTLLAKNGSMSLNWSDGTSSGKTFKITGVTGRLYNVSLGNKTFTINAAVKNSLIFTEKDAYARDNSIIFKRAP